ncbi:MAG TPA: STAS/SEC14 domain-containing protein [Blastocatellia bacterium]|nr:STAS/SEC14 domain-containing protein [Blastocatellia bacterium]HMV82795.1 STAS/SEC14 domain-containing protein [Blastocatellia bacterium]HMX27426.1 STAS/SEC14 domain-containing protein [Blastocatellia bacterium]HMY74015.1 STAS/SEC14 domain-containing protein [Blastocatellia bacterium]HMZ23095.1 STAS/SEC14 domain-containing protein [Blastocatellia bacterium]
MPKVQLKPQIEVDVDEVLNSIAQLKTNELEDFADQVLALRARRRAPSMPKAEAELLQKINQGLPQADWQRYHELNDKLHEEAITDEEHAEFLQLVDRIELADAERLRHLIELANIRNVSVEALMDLFGLRRQTYA